MRNVSKETKDVLIAFLQSRLAHVGDHITYIQLIAAVKIMQMSNANVQSGNLNIQMEMDEIISAFENLKPEDLDFTLPEDRN